MKNTMFEEWKMPYEHSSGVAWCINVSTLYMLYILGTYNM